jgi:hypothetical protein
VKSNTVERTYPLTESLTGESFVDDVRFNGATAYVTDAGDPGLVSSIWGLPTRVACCTTTGRRPRSAP